MADYCITGKKGTGKSLFAVGVIQEALVAKKRVATNLNIFLEQLMPATNMQTIIRLPDRPTVADLEALGRGQEGVIEEDNGVIVLDETSTFFNSRAFGDKERQPLLDWLVHSRKLGWDVYYICQGLAQIDKQLRETMIEYHVTVKRTDKWPIPVVTFVTGLLGYPVRFPKMHIGIIKQGVERDSLIVDRKFYRSHTLFNAYETQQLFLDRSHPKACAIHSVLSAWDIKGRYLPPAPSKWLRFVYGVIGHDWTVAPAQLRLAKKPKHKLAVLLGKLPPEQALYHWKRLESLGAFN